MYNNLKLKEGKTSPIEIIEYYFNNGSLRKTAREFNIHFQTLYKWIKNYKSLGESEKILIGYKRPWNRTKKEIEERIIFLKEERPFLSVRKAKEILEKEGIKISIKGIWNIWKRAGLAGFEKEKLCDEFIKYISWSKEAIIKYNIAKNFYEKGRIEKAAEILNSIPSLPQNDLISKIPEKYLNLKRKVEKMVHLFGSISLKEYLQKIDDLFREAKEKKLNYLALRIGIQKIKALEWRGEIKTLLEEINKLKKDIKNDGKRIPFSLFPIRFPLLISEGITYAACNIKMAKKIANECNYLLKNKKTNFPYFMLDLGSLYSNILEFNKAEYWISKGIDMVDENTARDYKRTLSTIYFNKGEYKKAFNFLKSAKFYEWTKGSLPFIYKSFLYILKGELQKAISILKLALKHSKKERTYLIFHSYFRLAFIYSLLNKKREAKNILKNILPFIEKNKLINYKRMIEPLIKDNKSKGEFPLAKLAFLLKNKKYYKAFHYAKNKGMINYLYIYVAFFPESVNQLIKKGKKTYLPKTILKFPIFNKNYSVYYLKFLGKLQIFKDKKYLKVKLSPKESAFLIHFALKAESVGKEVDLEEIYKNFWPKSLNPAKNLSILLFKLKKKLKIPPHFIEISKKENVVKNMGIYFITDYSEFETALTYAKSFLELGEYESAKKEFLRALKLWRGKPFEKMYDNWSEDLRTKILNKHHELYKK